MSHGEQSTDQAEAPNTRLDTPIQPCPLTATHWIEIELLDNSDLPVAYEEYKIVLPNGTVAKAVVDRTGWVRLGPFTDDGTALIDFPRLDRRVWSRIDSCAERGNAPAVTGRVRNKRPAGVRIVLQRGDCCTSLADATGHLWSTVWNDAANAGLQAECGDPNCLIPGRQLTIPVLETKQEPGAVDQRHRFRLESDAKLVIRVTWPNGTLRQNFDYTLQIDGVPAPRQTSASGVITIDHLPPQAAKGRLELFDGDTVIYPRFTFDLGALLPGSALQGVQQRLRNLGRRDLVPNGADTEATKEAVSDAQRAAGEAVTGVATDIAVRLQAGHGS